MLYEMLTGKRAFGGDDVTDTLAFIITKQPDWSALPPATPLAIQDCCGGALRKIARRRLPDIADARIEIDETLTTPVSGVPGEPAPAGPIRLRASRYGGQEGPALRTAGWRRVAAHVSTALVASAVVGAVVWLAARPILPPPRVSRFTITPPSAAGLTISGIDRDLAITPDGSRVVYTGANASALFVRALDQLDATRLTGLGTRRVGRSSRPTASGLGLPTGPPR